MKIFPVTKGINEMHILSKWQNFHWTSRATEIGLLRLLWKKGLSIDSWNFISLTRKRYCLPGRIVEINVTIVAQMVKNPPARYETRVWSLDWEDSLEKGMATHSSILAWRIPWTEEPGRGGYSSWALKESDMTEWLSNQHRRYRSDDLIHIWLL